MRWLVVTIACVTSTASPRAAEWRTEEAESRMIVHVFKTGFFSFLAHDHHFEVRDWSATLRIPDGSPSGAVVEAVAAAASLRDRQPALSEKDLAKVNAQVTGPEVLDTSRFPRLEFRSRSFTAERDSAEHLRGVLTGVLSAHGQEAPVSIRVDAQRSGDGWRISGDAALRQTALGIEPFSGFGGTVGVEDEVKIEISAVLRPVDNSNTYQAPGAAGAR